MSTTPKPKLPGAIRRKAVDLSQFNPVRETLLGEDQSLPLIMQPSAEHVDLTEWAAGNRDYIHKKLLVHGGILFRGFGLKSPADFERVVGTICNDTLPIKQSFTTTRARTWNGGRPGFRFFASKRRSKEGKRQSRIAGKFIGSSIPK